MLCHGVDTGTIATVGSRVVDAVCAPIAVGPHIIQVGASVGGALATSTEEVTELLRARRRCGVPGEAAGRVADRARRSRRLSQFVTSSQPSWQDLGRGAARSHAAPACARRPARGRRRGRAAVPRRAPAGRIPRRRRVLRAVGLPDHLAAAGRGRAHGHGRARRVLGPAGASPAPGAARGARRRRGVLRSSSRARPSARRSVATRSRRSATSRTGARSSAAPTTGRCSDRRRRSSTRGAWRSRSSSTWSGRCCSSRSAARAEAGCSRSRAASRSPSFVWMHGPVRPASPSRVYFGTDTRLAVDPPRRRAGGVGRAAGARARATPACHARSRGVVFGRRSSRYAWLRLDGSSPTLYRGGLFLTALAVACVIAAAVHPQRGGIARVALVPAAVRARAHQLRRLPLALADLRVARRATHAPRRLGAGRAAHRVTLAIATLSYFLLEQPIRHGAIPSRVLRPAVPALVGLLVVGLVFATASSSREERVVADPIRVAIAATRCRAGVGGRELGRRCSSPTRASRRCPRTRASTC